MRHLKNYFIPHEGNDHRPHSLRHKTILVLFLVIIIAQLGFLVQVFIVFDKTNFLASVLPAVLTSLTNDDRTDNNLPVLVENELLKKAAEAKAKDMAERGYFAHTSPDGKTPWYWLNEVGYKYAYAGENLAVNFFESTEVEQAWMNSPSHRANIVKKDYTEIGIGVATGTYQGRSTVFVAQFFGKPLVLATTTPSPITEEPTVKKEVTKPTTVPTKPVPTPTPVAQPTEVVILGEETTVNSAVNAPITTTPIDKTSEVNFLERISTSPSNSLKYVYYVIALFVLLSISLVVFIKTQVKHPRMVLRGVALVAVIAIFSFVNFRMLDIHTRVPSDITANVINMLPE